MMKIIKTIFLWLVFVAGLAHAQDSVRGAAQNKTPILHPSGLLWKIEKADFEPSYLFGTMHVGDPRVTELAPEVEKAFTQSKAFVMEMVLNFKAVGYVTSASFFSDGRTLQTVMGDESYRRLADLVTRRLNISEGAIHHMKPWAVLMLLMTPVEEHSQMRAALDMVLFRRATLRKIPVSGLETPQEQVSVFDSMSMQDQVWMLVRSVEEIDLTDEQMPELMKAYLARDLAGLVEIQQRFMYEDSEVDDRFMERLVDFRNVRMVERMQPHLSEGSAFIAIGALHLPGEQGVLHLLEQKGYTVTSLY